MDRSENKKYDICIIGGGASGLVAAIKAADTGKDLSIVILEKLDTPGHKVEAAGNGRCNLSNTAAEDWKNTSVFFTDLGLVTRIDQEGRIYPYSEDGKDVVRILTRACQERNIEIMTCRQVTKVIPHGGQSGDAGGIELGKAATAAVGFTVTAQFNKPKAYRSIRDENGNWEDRDISIEADKVLIATGGKSKPKLGTTGDGYVLARELGHTINTLIPVLTAVETREDIRTMDLSGIRQKGRISLLKEGELIFQEDGEVQFTDYGISGICVFDMSRFMDKDFDSYEVSIDFAPDLTEEPRSLDELCSIVKEPLAKAIVDRKQSLKEFKLCPKGLKGWDMAQVTRGGVPLEEIHPDTGESKICPGLYFAGEMLDRDFRCGGFNLQNAWTTGLIAGYSMAKK